MGVDSSNTHSAPAEGPGPRDGALRVVVADDDALLREGLASLLERSGFGVVGRGGNGTEGLDVARVVREEQPETGMLVLSAHVDVEHAMELLASGRAIGYLLKSRVTDVAELVASLERMG